MVLQSLKRLSHAKQIYIGFASCTALKTSYDFADETCLQRMRYEHVRSAEISLFAVLSVGAGLMAGMCAPIVAPMMIYNKYNTEYRHIFDAWRGL